MRNVASLLLVPLLAWGCGSAPASPTPITSSGPRGTSFALQFTPDGEIGKGWHSPVAVTLRSATFSPPGVIEKAQFKMIDEGGNTLAEASIAANGPLPADGYIDGTAVVQTLTWPTERGNGKRLDMTLTVRSASGELNTVNASISAR